MTAVVFAGPSLPPSKAPRIPGVQWRPPVRQGELYGAALSRPAIIGVVDGYFETVPTVWHKEILWAMAQGIHVYGAASTGALRAAELAGFGMKGIGRIYEQFRTGVLQDDDDVALLHGPEDIDYVPVTEAMVNVRATLDRAQRLGIVDLAAAEALIRAAKSLFYKDRTYEAVFEAAAEAGLPHDLLNRLSAWLPGGRVDQKREDALQMLGAVAEHLDRGVEPLTVSYAFAHTFAWEEARRRMDARPGGPGATAL